ncbi:CPBP family intramembrane glutamic endopeptidase [Salisediminibacterium halotolerans]|uniref:CPBP family intramembrane glutamic endopeptidase n=1 Tax=Salisediminibacterium halotolerans TaxID=517425 RepID=UPI000EB18AD3|nr:type II CAAX endopeptidase family protein [Salisediminibacterium halotolerans]RLJ71651.1 hypothetical protein BCL39_2322 [Actinophytocola xinjiangensis]RPE86801.1 hypothetical protein EDD67_1663 [Salisediminibacterium halotolerans]TWG32864.1 hypothetical protein BCL52_2317 [Salisediminibacterium halotolerans]GEL06956.1 peptidase [Salisediminibacterium halotolerans]
MNKKYWLIIVVFILMQLSPIVLVPALMALGYGEGTSQEMLGQLNALSVTIAFSIGFVIISLIAWRAKPDPLFQRNRAGLKQTVLWSIGGIFMAFAAQYAAGIIEQFVFGIEPGSENTEMIVDMATSLPAMMIVVAVFVPIMEEIVFRQVIFGSLYKKFNFWIAALTSGFIFALVHMDFEHLLIYLSMGVVFAYLYVKTKRIIVPILAHVGINSFVMLIQVVFGEQIQDMIDELEELEQAAMALLGGLF